MRAGLLRLLLLGGVAGIGSAQQLQTAFERGFALWQQGKYADAVSALRLWTQAHPRDGEAFVLLARCWLRLGDTVAAVRALDSALQAGWNDTTQLAGEWRFLERHRDGQRVVAALRRQAAAMGNVGVEFAPQRRLGRYFVLYPPRYSLQRRYYLVLLLHGNGQAPGQLFAWARQWQTEDMLIVAPEAPYVRLRPTLNAAALRFSALGEELGAADSLREEILAATAEWYQEVVEEAFQRFPLRRALPVVVGFSQGGFMAMVLLARQPGAYAGAALVAPSYYPEGKVLERLPELRRYGVSLLLLHGRQDPIVPFQTAELLANAFAHAGVEYEFLPFEGVHWPSAEATEALRQWLRKILQRY